MGYLVTEFSLNYVCAVVCIAFFKLFLIVKIAVLSAPLDLFVLDFLAWVTLIIAVMLFSDLLEPGLPQGVVVFA